MCYRILFNPFYLVSGLRRNEKVKKFISVLMVLVFMLSFATPAFAVEQDSNTDDEIPVRYQFLDVISASAEKKSFGFITCNSSYVCVSPNTTKVLYCYLQRVDLNGSGGWQIYKSASVTSTDANEFIEKTWFAPSGYAYRTYSVVVIKNSTGATLEIANCISHVIYKY